MDVSPATGIALVAAMFSAVNFVVHALTRNQVGDLRNDVTKDLADLRADMMKADKDSRHDVKTDLSPLLISIQQDIKEQGQRIAHIEGQKRS